MEDEIKVKKSIEIREIFKQSLLLYKENFSLFIGIIILGHALGLLDTLLAITSKAVHMWIGFITGPLGIFISIWASIALIIATSNKYLNNTITLKECFVKTKGKYCRCIGISILYLLILGAGLLLFLIPGIYWGTILTLATVVVVLEKRKDIGPFRISKVLIKGSFWKVFLLGIIMLLLQSPLYFIYFRLTKINQNFAMILGQIFFIFYFSFSTVVEVILYYRLKEKREGELPLESEATVKRGKGCLGCLGAIGLTITIIVLSSIWITNLVGFIKSEKGNKYYEWVVKKISPKIIFPGAVSLDRPEGYLVLKSELSAYSFYRFRENKSFIFEVFSIPLKDLGIKDKSSISLGDGIIWEKYFDYLSKQSPYIVKSFSDMEKQPIKLLQINGRTWVEFNLKQKERAYSKSRKVWVYTYTLSNESVIFISYGYKESEDLEEPLKKALEIQNILKTMNFSND